VIDDLQQQRHSFLFRLQEQGSGTQDNTCLVGVGFLASGCHGGVNLAHRFRRVCAPRCGPRQRENLTRVSGNTGRRDGYVSFGIENGSGRKLYRAGKLVGQVGPDGSS
jgi:hypothetical protein